MKILIADDHALVREGIEHVLKRIYDQVTIVQATDYTEALALAPGHQDIDLLLLDLTMPGMDRYDGLQKIQDSFPGKPVVVLSASEDPADVRHVLNCGAKGFIPKSSSSQIMIIALDLVLSGGVYVPPEVLATDHNVGGKRNDAMPNNADLQLASNKAFRSLTRRQREVLALVAEGKTNKEIGRELNLSEGTVRTHLTTIFRVLDVKNRTQAGRLVSKLDPTRKN